MIITGGRDQNAKRASCGDHARRELHVVTGLQHRIERDDAHQHDDRSDQAARDSPERAHDQRRHRQRRGHAAKRELDRVEHLVDERAALHHITHQHEERDRDQRLVVHAAVGALDDQIEDPVVGPGLGRVVERNEAEEHAQPHQRECRGEPQHDHDDDEREHQQAEGRIAHWCVPTLAAAAAALPPKRTR
jgi:hypothetical protein